MYMKMLATLIQHLIIQHLKFINGNYTETINLTLRLKCRKVPLCSILSFSKAITENIGQSLLMDLVKL